ncbi:MAG: ROK family protein [Sciscionella sp.]
MVHGSGCAAAVATAPAAVAAVAEEANRLGFVLASVTAVLDPELIVLGGGIGAGFDLLAQPLRRSIGRAIPHPPRVVAGHLGEDAVLTGAIATSLDNARDVVFARARR